MTKYVNALKQPSNPVEKKKANSNRESASTINAAQLITTIACLAFFPLIYVVGKVIVSFFGN